MLRNNFNLRKNKSQKAKNQNGVHAHNEYKRLMEMFFILFVMGSVL